MPGAETKDGAEAARAFNRRTAADYDAILYTPQPEPMLDLERVFGLGSVPIKLAAESDA